MPRSTIGNRRAAAFDKSLELRDYALAAISATTAGTGIPFSPEKTIMFRAIANYPTYTGYVAGTAQWEMQIQASTTLTGTYVTIASVPLVGTQQVAEVAVSGLSAGLLAAGAKFVRVNLVKTGTPGNLQCGAYLAN